jgi:hypothetical protein
VQQAPIVVPFSIVDSSTAKARNNIERNPHKPLARDTWSDVDLARWAAVNRGTVCPSPVPVLLPRPASDLARTMAPGDAVRPVSLQVQAPETVGTGARRRLHCEMDGAEEAVEAIAAKKFSVLEDKDAACQRASEPDNRTAAPVAVGKN